MFLNTDSSSYLATNFMYEQHWQLADHPFENNSDPRFFFRSETHEAALLKMRYLIENNKGAGILAGATGMGKTYVAGMLAADLPENFAPLVHIVFPQMSSAELLAYLAVELGADEQQICGAGLDVIVRRIQQQLAAANERGQQPVILIDEAHTIDDPSVFATLRLLLNFQEQGHMKFTLIFLAQHSLLSRIRRLGELEERLTVNCLLQPFSFDETVAYIQHRLQAAGASEPVFGAESLETIFAESGGIPRKINRLADLALLVGYADDSRTISRPQAEAVAEEVAGLVSY
jgi:type II secretory pathway predicted ATPase ExeA